MQKLWSKMMNTIPSFHFNKHLLDAYYVPSTMFVMKNIKNT